MLNSSCDFDMLRSSSHVLTESTSFDPHSNSVQLWVTSLSASLLVGMAGIVPIAFVSFAFECVQSSKSEANKRLRLMLSFAVGALLGDTFLHLLPEAWSHFSRHSSNVADTHQQLGYLVLLGMTTFISLQMIFAISEKMVCLSSSFLFTRSNQVQCSVHLRKEIRKSRSKSSAT
jgi:hypothetical protein